MNLLPQLAANSLIAGATYVLITLGFNLIYGTTRFVNMAHGVVAASGGYAMFALAVGYGMNIYLAVACGVIAAGGVGVLLDYLVFTPLRRRRASSLTLFIASLGAFTTLQAVLAIVFSVQFQVVPWVRDPMPVYEVAGASVTQLQAIAIVLAVLLSLGVAWLLHATKFGKAVRAVADDEEVAAVLGINTNRIIHWTFFLGSALAGLAGIVIGLDTGLQPTMGLHVLLEGAVASIIGGIGSLSGGVLGSALLAAAENFGIWKIPSEWKSAITFSVLVLFLMFRPQGLMNRRT